MRPAPRRILAFCLLTLLTTPLVAEVRLATGNLYPPFAGSNLPYGGLSSVLVKTVFEDMEVSTDIVYLPWRRAYTDTLNGRYDLSFPYMKTEDRLSEMIYSDVLVRIHTYVISTRKNPILAATSPDELIGKRLCNPLGWALPKSIEERVATGAITMEVVRDMSACFRMLTANRADFVITNSPLWYQITLSRDIDPGRFHMPDRPLVSHDLYLVGARTEANQALMDAFNRSLRTIRHNGEYQRATARFFRSLLTLRSSASR